MEPQSETEASVRTSRRVLAFVIKIVVALLILAVGFGLGVLSGNIKESRQAQFQTKDAGTVPEEWYGSSAVAYQGGIALYFLEKGTQCGDHPRYACRGALYEMTDGRMKQVASRVEGAELIYYKPGVRALLQSRWGDGGCRDAKFYVYDFVTASSTKTFDKSNCDEAAYDAYMLSIDDYLSQFSSGLSI